MKPFRSSAQQLEAEAAQWLARRDAGWSAADAAAFARWCAADPRHAQAVARYDAVWQRMDGPRQGGRADAMVRELQRRQRVRRGRRLGAGLALASVALLIGGLFLRPRAAVEVPAVAPTAALPATAQLVRPETQTLPDGSTVELNRGADIAVEFTPAERRVQLVRGEAHFAVAQEAARPFVVRAGAVDFRAVGTAFAVRLDAQQAELVVTHGRVAVAEPPSAAAPAPAPNAPIPRVLPATALPTARAAPPAPAATPPPHAPERALLAPALAAATFGPGSQVRIAWPAAHGAEADAAASGGAAQHTIQQLTTAELARRLSWRSPRLEFSGTPLGDAVALVNRYTPVPFVLADPSLARVEVSGYLRADNTDAFLLLVRESLGLVAEDQGQAIVLRRR